MKDHVIIVNAHINNEAKERILIECINQLKKTGIDIMVSSHTRISPQVLDLIDYYVFDKDNPMIKTHTDFYFWKNHDIEFKTKTPLSAHSYTALKNVKNAAHLAKSVGKKYFYHIEYDCIINDQDVETLKTFPTQNKGYLGYLDVYNLSPGHKGISMLFYYSEVDSFLKITQIPDTVEEYTEYIDKFTGGVASEMYLYSRFENYLGAYKCGERNKDVAISLLTSDSLSLSDTANPDMEYSNTLSIVPNKHNREQYYLCIINNSISGRDQEYVVNLGNEDSKIKIGGMCLYYGKVKFDSHIKVQIQKENSLETIFDQPASEWIDNLLLGEYIEFT